MNERISGKVKLLCMCAVIIALDVLFTRVFVILAGPSLRFDIQTPVDAIGGYMLGPIWADVALVASDILTGNIYGTFFIGFTLSAALRGFYFGYLLHKKNVSPLKFAIIVGVAFILIDVLLTNFWLSIMYGSPYIPLLISRLPGKSILLVGDVIIAFFLSRYLKHFDKYVI
jgi:ECF transporter S component (folate family)